MQNLLVRIVIKLLLFRKEYALLAKEIYRRKRHFCVPCFVFHEKVNPYSRFTPTTSFNEISAIGGEPQIKNPNSFKNVRAIVRTIASQANIKLYSDSDKES